MFNAKGWVTAAVMTTALGAQAAPLEGEFVLVGSSAQGTFNGTSFVRTNPFDIYEFRVTNQTGQNLFTFQNLVFSGQFLQTGNAIVKQGTQLGLDPFDAFIPGTTELTPDTFFTDNNAAPVSPTIIVDSSSQLSSVAIGILGQPWIVNGQTEALAVFSVVQGTSVNFVSGGGTTGSVLTPITIVPEPASVAMLTLGGLMMLRRRVA
jgi:hypothetical protein